MVDEIKVILDITKTRPQSKRECFLKFAALNRLNALVKKDVYKGVIKYWQIKPKVYELVKAVFEAGHREFFDAIYWDKAEKCIYINIYGLQFCFHNVTFDGLSDDDKSYITAHPQNWEALKLQPISETIYMKGMEIQKENLTEGAVQRIISDLKDEISNGKETI